jgi:hypothetical protein
MTAFAQSMISCGVGQIYGLWRFDARALVRETLDWGAAMYVFSDAQDEGNGAVLATFIRKNKLGKLVESCWEENPNSGNMIKTWIWTPDVDELRGYLAPKPRVVLAKKKAPVKVRRRT